MPRITARYAKAKAEDEMRNFLRGRALAYVPSNVCLSTDYTLRWLNRFPKDPEALSLGQLLGDAAGQPELSEKCFEALQGLVAEKARREGRFGLSRKARGTAEGSTLTEEQQGELLAEIISPEIAEMMVSLQGLVSEAANGEELGKWPEAAKKGNPLLSPFELLTVRPTTSLEAIQQSLDAAGKGRVVDLTREATVAEEGDREALNQTVVNHRRVEILSPTDAPYGRGLFASAPLRQGEVLFSEVPALHVVMPPSPPSSLAQSDPLKSSLRITACSYCGKSLPSSSSHLYSDTPSSSSASSPSPCRSGCGEVRYCSSVCEANGYAQCHGPVCSRTNPLFMQWAAPLIGDYYCSSSNATSASSKPSSSAADKKAALTMYAVGMACATATAAQIHPLRYRPFSMLSGQISYQRETALAHTGAIAVGLASALRQEHLYLDDVMSLFAVLVDNGFYNESRVGTGAGAGGVATAPSSLSLYPLLSMVNHSCVPNAVITDASSSNSPSIHSQARMVKQLTVLKDILPGEQIFINYNSKLMGSGRSMLNYEARRELLAQRHIVCTCPKCVLRQ